MEWLAKRRLLQVQVLLCFGLATALILTSRSEDWRPLPSLVTLLILLVVSERLCLNVRNLRVSGGFSAMVLTMVLFGPAPAAVIAISTLVADLKGIRTRDPVRSLMNLLAYLAVTLTGGLLARHLLAGSLDDAAFAAIVMAIFGATNVLNFVVIYGCLVITERASWRTGFKQLFVPVLPAMLLLALLTAGTATVIRSIAPAAIAFLAIALLLFQYILKLALEASEQREELRERNEQLAALQVGLISTMLKTLNLRDNMTARHSAAVARYARETARALGLTEEDQDMIHTAGLFHDVGKFIFPDSILMASSGLTDEQFAVVKRHPEVGAELIDGLEGYQGVAEIVRHHHEQIAGAGYPSGLIGDAIPLGSRIVAVADVYDVITARDTYRQPVSTKAACAELRCVAGTQLDAHIVEVFIALIETERLSFRHQTDADFEAELALDRRVRDYAKPLK